jgi:hypothetical protein
MRVSLDKVQAELRDFTWKISLLALGLSVPLLLTVFVFIRRFDGSGASTNLVGRGSFTAVDWRN